MTALLLELSDDLYEPIKQQALNKHKNPEQIVIELLRQLFEKPKTEKDDFLQLAGCIQSELADVSGNHDFYLGQAINNDQ
jgi:hypothetical protein